MMILIDKSEVGRTDAALLAEELIEIYSTHTPKGWHKPKSKGTGFWLIAEMSVTIAEVKYLYPRIDYKSWSKKDQSQNLEKKMKHPNLR